MILFKLAEDYKWYDPIVMDIKPNSIEEARATGIEPLSGLVGAGLGAVSGYALSRRHTKDLNTNLLAGGAGFTMGAVAGELTGQYLKNRKLLNMRKAKGAPPINRNDLSSRAPLMRRATALPAKYQEVQPLLK